MTDQDVPLRAFDNTKPSQGIQIAISMATQQCEIVETDEAGNVTATYVQTVWSNESMGRVDVINTQDSKAPWQRVLDIFLPSGYPHSVTDDYLEYQIYDSLQAFSSSIAGLLSSRAVLSSVGVGDSSASPTAALILSIIQESAGRIATIMFAWRFGTSLEPECKMYRLLADILNDFAFVLDCLSPAFPKPLRVLILSFSSVLRALCGVAAGSAKASLSAHFARWGNLGELNAKDSSQETVISLLGMLLGSVVVQWVTTPFATWTTLILLLSIHLETNRRAVRAVSMRTLNRQRADLVYHHLRRGHVPSPKEVSDQEYIFAQAAVLRDANGEVLGFCKLGASMSTFLQSFAPPHPTTKSTSIPGTALTKLLKPFQMTKYVMWYDPLSIGRKISVHIALKKDATARDQLMAWWHATALAEASHQQDTQVLEKLSSDSATLLERSMSSSSELLVRYETALTELGWDLDTGALETGSNTRLTVK